MWYAIWIIGLGIACAITIISLTKWEKKKGHLPRKKEEKPLSLEHNKIQPQNETLVKNEPKPVTKYDETPKKIEKKNTVKPVSKTKKALPKKSF